MKATKIKMMAGCGRSNNLLEIDEIYLVGSSPDGYYKKAAVHDYLVQHPGSIQVNIAPYPNCVHAKSPYGEKYVKSTPDYTTKDNLLNLPRE
jgi:hypothetical protein